ITIEELRIAEETIGNPESDQYDEDKFCNVLRSAIDAGILNEADRLRATYRIEIAAKNRPGTTASDFNFLTRSGKHCHLLGFNSSKPILLFFYDPDCDHCMQTIAQLKQTAIPDKAEVVAIYAEDDRERWEETYALLPEDWTVGYALDPIQDDETYIFLTSPTLYLLTPQKTILLKDTTLTAIEEMLQTHGQNSPDKDE
ncbi:MAG: thioredoxin family protein, partial [Muribaculaceae bacterium]|nr:thioredoxin family protein [Muribaculaceae bacterium]